MNDDLISIIVPIYNVEKYLDKCLDSIRNQTYSNIEVIMVNDGSTDTSREIACRYQKSDERFLLVDKENGGLSSARNFGMKYIRGKFVSFIDSDDFLVDTYVEKLFSSFSEEIDIVIGDYAIYNAADGKAYLHGPQYDPGIYSTSIEKEKLISALFEGYPVMSVWKNMYRVPFLEQNKLSFVSERIVYAEDKLFHTEAYTLARSVKIIPDIVFYHLIVPGSLSQSYRENYFEMNKELFFRIRHFLLQHYSEQFIEEYDAKIPSEIGASMLNMCKCGFHEAIANMKHILNDEDVSSVYQHNFTRNGHFRHWILYSVGKMKSPVFIVLTAKAMLLCNPLYRFMQRKQEYLN